MVLIFTIYNQKSVSLLNANSINCGYKCSKQAEQFGVNQEIIQIGCSGLSMKEILDRNWHRGKNHQTARGEIICSKVQRENSWSTLKSRECKQILWNRKIRSNYELLTVEILDEVFEENCFNTGSLPWNLSQVTGRRK